MDNYFKGVIILKILNLDASISRTKKILIGNNMGPFSVNNLYSFSYYASSFLKEGLPALTQKQKKVALVAIAAFVCLSTCYALYRSLFQGKEVPIDPLDPNQGVVIIKGDIKNGIGEKRYPDGRLLKGEFKDSVLNGKGKKIFIDGRVADGTFRDGELIKGKLTDKNGWNIDEGEFKDYLLVGQGKRTGPNKMVEEGEFVQGKFVKGRKTLDDGLAEGEFKDEKLHGQGKLTWFQTKPHIVTREGRFFEGSLFKGKHVNHVGNIFEGVFGTLIFVKGGYNWETDGHLQRGKITYLDGTIEEGEFTKEKLNGKGKRTKPDGSIEEGNFRNGVLI